VDAVTSWDRVAVDRFGPAAGPAVDDVAVEEPLEVRVDGIAPWVTMRTPGHDTDLALGWLVCEGVVAHPADVVRVRERARGEGLQRASSVEVVLADGVSPPPPRAYPGSSACGVCGSDAVETVMTRAPGRVPEGAAVAPEVVASLPDRLRAAQAGFSRTGGLHAAGLFALADGAPLVVREDVGRHNAVDKVVGWALRQDLLPLSECALQVSGRASFELVQKAIAAGIPVFCAVSAPSSLAAALATAGGVTLAAFVRDGSFVVYSGAGRFSGA
jgi:FdhD protein